MPLRDGKEYLKKIFPKETQPFNLVLLPEKSSKQYMVNIDFDDSSLKWRRNKIQLGGGLFKYKRQSRY